MKNSQAIEKDLQIVGFRIGRETFGLPIAAVREIGEPVGSPNKKNRIVVVEVENRALGLMVNSASEVLKIPPSEIEAPHSVFQEGDLNYITGVGKLHGRLVILLDLAKVLQRGELKRLEEAATAEREPETSKSRTPVLSTK